MQYLITFLEGIFSFLSPCMLPMLPVYLTYFAAGQGKTGPRLGRILAFIGGFTLSFVALGLFFSAVGMFLTRYQVWVNLVCGLLMILFGLSCLEVISLPFFRGMNTRVEVTGLLSAFLFGLVYSVSLTPCVGAFLGSALMLAATAGSVGRGVLLLLLYSLGLGLPFLLSGVLVGRLDSVFRSIKTHYLLFNRICGGFLILVGILTCCGLMSRVMGLFL